MLVRHIRASFPVFRHFCFSTLTERLLCLRNPSEAPRAISKWRKERHDVSPGAIIGAVNRLTNLRRYSDALMIWDSLVKKNVVEMNPEDYASHMGLIANGRGLDSAEKYFEGIPEGLKDEIIYNALLNIYAQKKETAKAEALMEKMAGIGFMTSAKPYIHMMSLYMSIGEDDKAEEMIKEVKKLIDPSADSYNVWLNECASINNVEAAEMVFYEMKEAGVRPNWVTHGTLASLYIKNKLFEKAVSALRRKEELLLSKKARSELPIGVRSAYRSLIRDHGRIGSRDGILRIWKEMKLKLDYIGGYEYSNAVSMLMKVESFEEARKIHSEWAKLLEKRRAPMIHGTTFEHLMDAKAAKNAVSVAEEDGGKPLESPWEADEECNVKIK